MAEFIPHARPLVPIKRIQHGTSGPTVTYEARCKVLGCGWTKSFPVRASLEYSVDEHKRRHRHAAEAVSRG
jgi:hypothetical protein